MITHEDIQAIHNAISEIDDLININTQIAYMKSNLDDGLFPLMEFGIINSRLKKIAVLNNKIEAILERITE